MNKQELINVKGGAFTINSTSLNALARIGTLILEMGRSLGSALRRSISKNYCN